MPLAGGDVASDARGGVPGKPAPKPVAPQPGSGGGPVDRAGFAEGSSLMGRSDAALTAELDGIAATGAAWLRVDINWHAVQLNGPQAYDWWHVDRVIQAARARGLKVLALIAYTPPWARPPGGTDMSPPADISQFANFARTAVQRYAPVGVRDWEIWNEPNLGMFWAPAPDPAKYAALLAMTYDTIKATDPHANVLSGGLSPAPDGPTTMAPVTFLQRIYQAGARGKFDAVAHHPSNYPYMPMKPEPDYNWNAFGGVTPKLNETMVANGDGHKKIWGTEMGAPTVQGMTPEYVADYLTEAYTVWKSWSYTGPLLWFSYRDAWYDPDDPEANFGLVRTDGTPKEPALSAYRAAIRA
jgi:polysaccharide biosynthesis protein PslG